ncbi:RNA-binding domain-containing protein [Chloropicon primus]|uniref:RNA-binding domain-containing protein n=1 Tax=Chloropicon primus TaxID=1764295 RepID=A0A5B8MVY4_9CHLO|nr:RNA-binding domain-containing protein [Chloropicon primus]UPR03795.1 RNA-binding domain-containing protein [Chloropicon primus]|mmetsp:Transcript_5713/g.17286  ORF Transcript_5713/g.17286 Transcript_5713/m.17286 type:complete len:257 (+) Transcript_5713:408-1178(+)|eukprot:QDZ24587.1 RNA-binding domain-containing protein [Chloropicon primus]
MDPEQQLDMALDDVVDQSKAVGYGAPGGMEAGAEGHGQVETITVGKRCYVGNLSWRTSWQDLKDHFRQVGNVVFAEVMMEPGSERRSKGCGIVEFETPEEAARAIVELHDSVLEGRKIMVREDREDYELKRRGQGGGGGGGGYGQRPPREPRQPRHYGGGGGGMGGGQGKRIFVSNLAWETSWQDLKDHFKQSGNVVYADVMKSGERSKGCGIVEFDTAEEASQAIADLNESVLHDRNILVREDREEGRGGRGGRY